MNNNQLDILLEDDRWLQKLPEPRAVADTVFLTTLNYLQTHNPAGRVNFAKPLNMALVLSNDEEVRKLNAEFRGLDKPTNVLSFANIDDSDFARILMQEPEVDLGGIIIALETLEREAETKQISRQHHFAHLLTHGILHLFGYDHIKDDQAEEMEQIEIAVLQKLNINNPYEEL